MAEPDCPKCAFTPLEPRLSSGLSLDECPKCGGRWYDAGELERAVLDPAAFQRAGGAALTSPRPGKAICPRCHENMTNGGLLSPHLRVDRCGKCGGVWLDKNEIPLLDRLLLERGAPPS